MNELTSIYQLLDKLGIIDEFYKTYGPILIKSALVFALLNCFFGYRLRKLWSCIFGILLGVGGGLAAAIYMDLPGKTALAAAAVGGIIFMALAFLLYRIGMFFLCIGAVIMTLFQLFPMPTFSTICGFTVFGVVMGFLAVIKEHTVVIYITAICGGIGSAKLIFMLTSTVSPLLTVLLALVLSALGLVFQLKPWKEKEYWNKEEDKNTRKRQDMKDRHKSRKKTRKKSSASASSKPDRKPAKKGASRSGNSKRSQTPPNSPNEPARPRTPGSVPSGPDPQPQADSRSTSTPGGAQTNIPNLNDPNTPKASPRDPSYTVDLSDIRTEISKEVQDIYKEKQDL